MPTVLPVEELCISHVEAARTESAVKREALAADGGGGRSAALEPDSKKTEAPPTQAYFGTPEEAGADGSRRSGPSPAAPQKE